MTIWSRALVIAGIILSVLAALVKRLTFTHPCEMDWPFVVAILGLILGLLSAAVFWNSTRENDSKSSQPSRAGHRKTFSLKLIVLPAAFFSVALIGYSWPTSLNPDQSDMFKKHLESTPISVANQEVLDTLFVDGKLTEKELVVIEREIPNARSSLRHTSPRSYFLVVSIVLFATLLYSDVKCSGNWKDAKYVVYKYAGRTATVLLGMLVVLFMSIYNLHWHFAEAATVTGLWLALCVFVLQMFHRKLDADNLSRATNTSIHALPFAKQLEYLIANHPPDANATSIQVYHPNSFILGFWCNPKLPDMAPVCEFLGMFLGKDSNLSEPRSVYIGPDKKLFRILAVNAVWNQITSARQAENIPLRLQVTPFSKFLRSHPEPFRVPRNVNALLDLMDSEDQLERLTHNGWMLLCQLLVMITETQYYGKFEELYRTLDDTCDRVRVKRLFAAYSEYEDDVDHYFGEMKEENEALAQELGVDSFYFPYCANGEEHIKKKKFKDKLGQFGGITYPRFSFGIITFTEFNNKEKTLVFSDKQVHHVFRAEDPLYRTGHDELIKSFGSFFSTLENERWTGPQVTAVDRPDYFDSEMSSRAAMDKVCKMVLEEVAHSE
jgi:Co/Zn/Cd efflux system component